MENNVSKNKKIVLDLLDSTNLPKGVEIIDEDFKPKTEMQIAKLKKTLGSIEWSYEKLFDDLNGFVESQEQSSKKLLTAEREKNKLKIDLDQAVKKIKMLNQKLQDHHRMSEDVKASYQKRLQETHEAKSELNKKIAEITTKKRQTEEQYNRLLDGFKRKESEIETSKAQTESIKKQMEAMRIAFNERIVSSKTQIKEHYDTKEKGFVAKVNQLKTEKDKLILSNEMLKIELSKTGITFSELQRNLNSLKAEKGELHKANDELQKIIEDKEKAKVGQHDKLEILEKKYNIALISFKKKQDDFLALNDKYHEIQTQKNELIEKVKTLTNKAEEFRDLSINKNMELEKQKTEFQVLHHTLAEERKSTAVFSQRLNESELEMKKFFDEIRSLKDQLAIFKSQEKDQEKQILKLKLDLEEAKVREDKLLSDLESAKSVHEAEIKSLTNVIDNKESVISKIAEEKGALAKQLASVKTQIEKYVKEVDAYNIKVEDLNRNVAVLKSEFAKKEKDYLHDIELITKERNEIKASRDSFENQVAELKEEVLDLNQRISRGQEENRALSEQIKGATEESDKLTERLQNTLQDKNASSMALEVAREDLENLRKNLVQKTFETNNLKGLLFDKETAVNLLEENRQNLEDQIVEISKELSAAEERIAEGLSENVNLNKRIDDLSVELMEANEQKSNLEDQMKALELELQSEQEQNRELNNNLETVNNEIVNFKMQETEFVEKIQALEEEKNNWDLKMTDYNLEKQEIEDGLQKQIDLVQEQKGQIVSELEESNSKIIELESKIKYEADAKKILEDKIASLEGDITYKTNLLNGEVENYKNKMNDQLETVQDFENSIVELKADIQRLTTSEKSHLEKIESLTKALENKEKEAGALQNEVKKETLDSSKKYGELSEKYFFLEQEMSATKQSAEDLKSKIFDQEAFLVKLNDQKQQLKDREEQLSYFSRWVDLQKQALQNHVVKLAQELRASVEMSPLKTYLQITEREISKLEVLLSKSNVFGAVKLQYEEQYEQLIKQRDEIKELISVTTKDINDRADKLTGMLKSSEFIPVPPLPPTSKK